MHLVFIIIDKNNTRQENETCGKKTQETNIQLKKVKIFYKIYLDY